MGRKCKECEYMQMQQRNAGRNIFYCIHDGSRTECLPHGIIARARETKIPIKTAPRWCPLREKVHEGEEKKADE